MQTRFNAFRAQDSAHCMQMGREDVIVIAFP